jgi:hypothetical protein
MNTPRRDHRPHHCDLLDAMITPTGECGCTYEPTPPAISARALGRRSDPASASAIAARRAAEGATAAASAHVRGAGAPLRRLPVGVDCAAAAGFWPANKGVIIAPRRLHATPVPQPSPHSGLPVSAGHLTASTPSGEGHDYRGSLGPPFGRITGLALGTAPARAISATVTLRTTVDRQPTVDHWEQPSPAMMASHPLVLVVRT